jgi:predicted transposase YbfD/YdcC
LATFLELPHGIPSHDTIGRLFSLLDPKQLQACFLSWVNSLVSVHEGEIIAIDGKTLRNSHDRSKSRQAIHMISAWAVNNRLVLGQLKTEDKSNEITAIPELLNMLEIKGATITLDAMGCQKEIAAQILAKEADYVMALKGNQGNLHDDVKEFFVRALHHNFKHIKHDYHENIDGDHGRVETRRYWLISRQHDLASMSQWPGLKGIGMVSYTREIGEQIQTETRFYLTSFMEDAKRFALSVRNHWQIEINLHWSLDVSFHEDLCRVRSGHAAENFAVIRHIALNLLKNEKTSKVGIATKRKRSGWDERYLAKVLAVGQI